MGLGTFHAVHGVSHTPEKLPPFSAPKQEWQTPRQRTAVTAVADFFLLISFAVVGEERISSVYTAILSLIALSQQLASFTVNLC